jgi:hypothetical protein
VHADWPVTLRSGAFMIKCRRVASNYWLDEIVPIRVMIGMQGTGEGDMILNDGMEV